MKFEEIFNITACLTMLIGLFLLNVEAPKAETKCKFDKQIVKISRQDNTGFNIQSTDSRAHCRG